MGAYMQAALEAVNFIGAQRLEGRTKWRRADDAGGSDYGLYHGSSGIILLLLELHAATGSAQALEQAIAAGEEVAAHLARVDSLSVSASNGWPGYAFAMSELARVSGREDFRALAGTCLQRLRDQAKPLGAGIGWIEPAPFSEITGFTGEREIYDQSVGAAGAGLVMLYGDRNDLHPDALDWAVAVGERLLEVAESDPDGLRWRLMSDMPFAFTAPNFAHGGAGGLGQSHCIQGTYGAPDVGCVDHHDNTVFGGNFAGAYMFVCQLCEDLVGFLLRELTVKFDTFTTGIKHK